MSIFGTYDSKPKQVEAVQFTDENKDRIRNELTGNHAVGHEDGAPILKITTIHGETAVVRLGDWIVKDADIGTYYPVKDEIFCAGYEWLTG